MEGTDSRMGRFHVSFPSSTRKPAAIAVKSFVFDAMGKSVEAVIGSFFS